MTAEIPAREGDIRVARGRWVYYVRPVPSGEPLVSRMWWDGAAVGPVFNLLYEVFTVWRATGREGVEGRGLEDAEQPAPWAGAPGVEGAPAR